jgi:LysM repeat protein
MQCFACDRPAIAQCQRCGNHHCADHGAALCVSCTDPVQAAPSSATFRIALAGLLGASVLALWLLVRPPSVPGDSGNIIQQPDVTPGFTPALTPDTEGTPRPTVSAGATSVPSGAPAATPTPAVTAAPTEGPTDAPAQVEYVTQEGDTWFGIAEAYGVDAANLAATNGYSLEDVLPLGVTLVIPQ